VSSTLGSGVTGSPCTTSGSQLQSIQAEGAEASGSQSVGMRSEVETLGRRDITSPLVTLGKRKPEMVSGDPEGSHGECWRAQEVVQRE
jgi:hypothetical protein